MTFAQWSDARRARFLEDWNEGLDSDALREKYGVTRPSRIAEKLRKLGVEVKARGRGAHQNGGAIGKCYEKYGALPREKREK